MEQPIAAYSSATQGSYCSEEREAALTPAVEKALQRLLRTVQAVRQGTMGVPLLQVGEAGGILDEIAAAMNGLVTQVTGERQAAEARLAAARDAAEVASRAKAALLANISHELRTPLCVMLGCCELLLDPRHSEDERRQWVGSILRNGRQLSCLISDFLDLATLEKNRLEVELVPVDVEPLIAEVLDEMAFDAERKGVQLRLDWRPGPCCGIIESDPRRLGQILRSVIGNALKFTERGEVVVLVETQSGPDPKIIVTVRDTGVGIDKVHVAQLFQPFTQADGSMTRRFGGTGLGLALSRRLAVALGGEVALCATEVDRGSAFSVTLPIRRSGEPFVACGEAMRLML